MITFCNRTVSALPITTRCYCILTHHAIHPICHPLSIILLSLLGSLYSATGYSETWKAHPLETQASFEKVISKKGPFTIAYMPPATEFNYYLDIGKGIKAQSLASQSHSFTFAPQSDNPEMQMKMIEEVIRRKVDAIILSTHNPELAAPLVKKAVDNGIVVVLINSDATSFTTPVHAIVGYSQHLGTKKIGEYIVKKTGPNSPLSIGIIEGSPGYHTTQRVGGFLKGIESSKLNVVSSLNGSWNTEGGYNAALKMFGKKPNIKLVFAANDFEIMGVSAALKSLKISDIMLLGNDGDSAALERIYTGELTATVYTDPIGMGEIAVNVVLDSLQGDFKGGFIETPTTIVDQANVEKYWAKPEKMKNSNHHQIVIVSNELPGLVEKSGEGLYLDIIREIYKPEEFTIILNLVPANRASNMVQRKIADIKLGSLKGELEGVLYPQWHYSADIISVFYRKYNVSNWKGQKTLKNKQIVWIRGYDFEQYLYVPMTAHEVTKGTQGLLMTIHDRTDFYLDSAFNIATLINENKKALSSTRYHSNNYNIQEVLRLKQYMAFSNTGKGVRLRKIFDDRFPKLLESGKLKSLFKKWGYEPFPFECHSQIAPCP